METSAPDSLHVRSVEQRKCFAAQGDKTPEAGPAAKYLVFTAGDSGDFGDAERHAPKPCCTAISFERESERPGIWRPQRRIHYMCGAWSNVSALPLKETKRPKQDPQQNTLFLTAGDSGDSVLGEIMHNKNFQRN